MMSMNKYSLGRADSLSGCSELNIGRPSTRPDRAIGPFSGLPGGPVSERASVLVVEVDDAHAHGPQHGLRAVARVELLVDRGQVVLHRLDADVELGRHLCRREAVGHELEDLLLALAKERLLGSGAAALVV